MSKLKNKKVLIPLVVIAVTAVILIVLNYGKSAVTKAQYGAKYEGENLEDDMGDIGRQDTYMKYLASHEGAVSPEDIIEVDVFNYTPESEKVEIIHNIGGLEKAVQSNEDGFIEWKVNVPNAGLYNIEIEYYPVKSRGISIERSVFINGKTPFYGADALTFSRVWTDESETVQDNRGNDIRPSQVEEPVWQKGFFRDYMGYETEPYQFYFEKGENTLRLDAINEPLLLKKVTIKNQEEKIPYLDYIAKTDLSSFKNSNLAFLEKYQGEDSARRSSPSLYATSDRASSNTEPYSPSKIKLNKAGGEKWKVVGDWIEWDIEVPEDGLYTISLKTRQSYNRGFVSNRSIYIDGKIPFEEVSKIGFSYSTDWKLITPSDENGTPYQFPLTAGKHTIRLEVTLGDLGDILKELNDSVFRLNAMYRKILVLTGAEPDQYRDYKVEEVYPDVISGMALESKRLYKIVDDLTLYAGQKGTQVSTALTLAAQLERFVDRPDKIPKTLNNFKDNVSALGTSVLTLSEAPLDIDYLVIAAPDAELPDVRETFLDSTAHEVRTFISSFMEDYTSVGSVFGKGENTIEVWMQAGRDQSAALKSMIDDTFTPDTGINVNIKLVEGISSNATNTNALLNAVLANTGPDVALTVPQTEPVNYALRNATIELSQFEGFHEVLSEYYESSYESYKFNGGMYGLPETQNYNVLFYRTDILEELGLEPPDTWQDLIEILPIIQNNNMTVGIPSVERKVGNTINPDLANYFAQLYQRGGKLYNEAGTKVAIHTEEAIEAFEFYTKFFTNYKLPKQYDFLNRFRTGEMPVGIADYNNFNTLAVFAPEIRGLWDFALMPGTERENGTIDRAVQSWGTCSMMLRTADNREAAWEFLKWWSSSETQVRFGREMESIMGASARYATANFIAFDQLAWSNKDAAVLKEQWKYAFGIPEIAGGYYTSRHITNAIRKVMNKKEDPRETLLDYVISINNEIDKKRKEFGFDKE